MARPRTVTAAAPGILRMVTRFSPYIRAQGWLIPGAFAALLAEVAFRLAEPWPLKFVFDRIIPTSVPSTGNGLVDSLGPGTLLAACAVVIVLLTGFRALAAYGSSVGFALIGNRVLTRVRDDLYNHVQRLSLRFHTKARAGDLTVRLISDVGLLQDVTVTAFLPFLGNILVLVSTLALMLWFDVRLTLVALAVTPLFWLRTVSLSRRIQDVSRKQRRRDSAMAAAAAESVSAIATVQTFALESAFAKTFAAQSNRSLAEGVQGKRLAARLERSVDLLIAVATALVLWYGALRVLAGRISPGDLLVFMAYLKNAFRPVRDFAKYTGRLAKASAAGERIIELLDQEPEVRNLPGAVPAPRLVGDLQFDAVRFDYEADRPALDGVNLHIRAGEHVALIGASGAGKSTLATLVLRLYDPTAGRVLLDGRDLREYTLESVREQIGVVLQDGLLFAGTIRDNIIVGRPAATEAEIIAAARLANVHEFILSLPSGYDTRLGERGVTISGGQRQRIAIARVAVKDPTLLILDEPTTGLDEETARGTTDALFHLAKGRTTLTITHDLRLASRADRILVLDAGRIVEDGMHAELIGERGRYFRLWQQRTLRVGDAAVYPTDDDVVSGSTMGGARAVVA